MTQEFKQELFNICSQNKIPYSFIWGYVKIEENDTHDAFYITEVEWADSMLGYIDKTEIDDFTIENYQSHQAIKAPLSN